MELEGSFNIFPLSELITMIAGSSVTGVLEVGVHQEGRLFSRDGRPYHASYADLVGVDAVSRLFELKDAPFRFVAGISCNEKTIHFDAWDLVAIAERQAQLVAYVRKYIPSMEWVPTLCDSGNGAQIQITESVWPLLTAIDGQRSVTAIAEFLGQVQIEVAAALARLIEQRLVAIEPPRTLIPHQAPSKSAPTRGLLDRLMATSSE
jgi:hypothetical protein